MTYQSCRAASALRIRIRCLNGGLVSGQVARGKMTTMLSALDLARRIEDGTLTPAKIVDLCAEAIAAQDAEVGAFVALDIARARREAEAQARRPTLLRGLPVGVKDIFDTADFPTEYGSKIYAGYRPPWDCSDN